MAKALRTAKRESIKIIGKKNDRLVHGDTHRSLVLESWTATPFKSNYALNTINTPRPAPHRFEELGKIMVFTILTIEKMEN